MPFFLLLFFITALGAFLRLHNLSHFKLYPDSYQNLLVADNIRTYHSVVGQLGTHGMFYPDFFMWTRPLYALLINFVHGFGIDTSSAAQGIAIAAGVLAIPLAFFLIKAIWKSKTAGFAGAFFLALSFNHTIWSGFIMTETTGIFFMLLFLWSFFASLKGKASPADFLNGILFSFAVMTRYEYIVIMLPAIVLIFLKSSQPYRRIFFILSSFILSIFFVGTQIFPLQAIFVLFNQLPDLILLGIGLGGIMLAVILLSFASRFCPCRTSCRRICEIPVFTGMTRKIYGKFLIWTIFFVVFPFVLINIKAVSDFAKHDFLITFFFIIGMVLMLKNQSLRAHTFFVLFSLFALGSMYYHTNPEMERYMTHLLPFILIPASYGVDKIKKRVYFVIIAIFLVIAQAAFSFYGLRYLHDPSWYRMSYEEKVANMAKKYISSDNLLLVSLPEPYFYTIQAATYSMTDATPFIYIPDSLNKKEIFIIEDMGMHEIFPNFTKFLDNHMQDKKVTQFMVHEKFHIQNKSKDEKYPVIIYKTTVGEIKAKILNSKSEARNPKWFDKLTTEQNFVCPERSRRVSYFDIRYSDL